MLRGELISTWLLALAACHSGGAGQAPPADAGAPADAPPDTSAPDDAASPGAGTRSAVTGRCHETCLQQPADVDIPIDLSTAVIQALVPDSGAAGYRVIDGTGGADGGFAIPDVPDGAPFLLRIDDTYYATALHAFDVRSERRTRCAPPPMSTANGVTLNYQLTGMTPVLEAFDFGDGLAFASVASGYYSTGQAGRLRSGDVAAAGSLYWPGIFTPAPLVDAAAADDLHVFHERGGLVRDPVTQRLRSVDRIVDALDATGITLHDGNNALAGAFQPAAARTFSFSLDLAVLDADAGPMARGGGLTVGVYANPRGLSAGGARLLTLDLSDRSHSASTVVGVTDEPYGDPFPDSWTRSLYIDYLAEREYATPGFFGSTPILAHHQELRALGADPGPPLHAPSGATVNGVDFDAGGLIRFDGTAPVTVRWNPVPGATAYRVTIPFGGDAFHEQAIGTFWTTDTQLKIPAYLFMVGAFARLFVLDHGAVYALVIDAVQSPVDLATGHGLGESPVNFASNEQLRLPGPIRIAGRASGRFRFLPRCGDGAVQEGELCDTGGESATCNADCTVPACGDGLRNAAAGVVCDTVEDSRACNFNCVSARCGDGHLGAGEDCDDGNALDDGNGCSADCHFNNHCGNGIVEDAAELCDPGPGGDSPTCDFDCTPAFCGDGYVNHAAGEECDDPFSTEDCVKCKLR